MRLLPGAGVAAAAARAESAQQRNIEMDFAAFEYDRTFVIEALRCGEIDYLENVSEAEEADLFRHLLGRDVLERLAEHYPTPRQKEEVPIWLYIASQISLKLHDASYHAFPYVLRSGGLITALGPKVGRQAEHPDTHAVTLACEGFHDKARIRPPDALRSGFSPQTGARYSTP